MDFNETLKSLPKSALQKEEQLDIVTFIKFVFCDL